MRTSKKWGIACLLVTLALLLALGAMTAIIDPYFHYHAPLRSLSYWLNDQRYQNDGIMRHFPYEAVITGSSMTENFATTVFEREFGLPAVKVPFSGASYKEIAGNLVRGIGSNDRLSVVVWGLDYNRLMDEKDTMGYEESFYPSYLYDDRLLNDVMYVFNKTVFLTDTIRTISYTRSGLPTTSFDGYCCWIGLFEFGREAVLANYARPPKAQAETPFSEEDRINLEGNLRQNIISLAEANPQIEFYLFFTPYSIFYWDSLNQEGSLKRQLEAERAAIELLLTCDNIRLYSFFDDFDMVTDPDNYMDPGHYSAEINTNILVWMHDGAHLLTRENYQAYCQKTYDFYTGYDYGSLFDEP